MVPAELSHGEGVSVAATTNATHRQMMVGNAVALYCVQGANIVLPFLTIPYLARVLKPDAWGELAVSQVVGQYVSMVVGYGFNVAATREIAKVKGDSHAVECVFAGVVGARAVLAMATAVLLGLLAVAFSCFGLPVSLVSWALVWGVCQGFSFIWFFQGMEELRGTSAVDVVARLGACGATFILVRQATDAWVVLMLLAMGAMISNCVMLLRIHGRVRLRMPHVHEVKQQLANGWTMFFVDAAGSMYTSAGAVLVNAFAGAASAGFYSSAEKICRVGRAVIEPVIRVVFPRTSALIIVSPSRAARLVLLVGAGLAAAVLIGSVVAAVLAPFVVRVLLGPGYEQVVPVLRVLLISLPAYALTAVLGGVWTYALGFDRHVTAAMATGGGVGLAAAIVLTPRLGATGMAVSAVLANFVPLIWYVLLLWSKSLLPNWNQHQLSLGASSHRGRIPVLEVCDSTVP